MPLAALTSHRPLDLVIAGGLAAIFFVLAILAWTRLGHARPVAKCVVLSLLAHILLLIYACSTHILYGPPGSWMGRTVMVRLRDAADDEEAARFKSPNPRPWEQSGQPDVPLAEALPVDRHAPTAADVTRTPVVANNTPPPQPQPVKLPTPVETAAAPPVPQPPPLLPDKPVEPTPPEKIETQEVAIAPPPMAPTISRAQPLAGIPAELVQPQAEPPRLTDLLPDHDGPPAVTNATNSPPAALPDNPLRTVNAAPSPDNVAANSGPATADNRLPTGQEFVASTAQSHPPRRLGDGQDVPEPLRARVAADRLKAAQPFGATPQTEAAVAAALDWLASAQSENGRWDADSFGAGRETRAILGHDRRGTGREANTGTEADMGVSGLALLAFLGAGETHLEGEHRAVVQRGLEFLLANQAADGNLAGRAELFAAMYCHGIATLAISEAYALSADQRLLPGLRRALQYTTDAQHPSGGWRYKPHREQPYDPGDMSQFGWQLMALKSAELGGIPMPDATRDKMVRFLQSCSTGRSRGLAAYRPGDRASRTMTAEALVCRYFLTAENAPAALNEAAAYVSQEPPGTGTANLYYWYYGTLALFQRQGDDWTRWNRALQSELLTRQRWDGKAIGSWDPDDLWGGYGGRVYSTALATLSLEVYYRYLPVYGGDFSDPRFTDRSGLPLLPR